MRRLCLLRNAANLLRTERPLHLDFLLFLQFHLDFLLPSLQWIL
jgi:hypothetical protein